MTTNTTPQTCRVHVYGSGYQPGHPCGRKVKENGKCGIHAAADKRDAAKEEERARNIRMAEHNREVSQPLKDALGILGIHYSMSGEVSYGSNPGFHEVRILSGQFPKLLEILQRHIIDNHIDEE